MILTLLTMLESVAQERQLPQPFMNYVEGGLIYNTVFTYKEHVFSGLMAIKQEQDSYRIVLFSKLGLSIMDFELTPGGLIWNKVPEEMKRPVIRKLLTSDFNLILLRDLENPSKVRKKRGGYKIRSHRGIRVKITDDFNVKEAEAKNGLCFFKTRALFHYIDDDRIPDEVCVSHNFVNMKMEMTLLENK